MNPITPEPWMLAAADALASRGWYHGASVIDPALIKTLSDWMLAHDDAFTLAAIGKGHERHADVTVRSDRTYWLPDHPDGSLPSGLFQILDGLRGTLNQELFTGLMSFEGHFAIYPPGGFYHRHLDVFRQDDSRMVTFILYLNERWTPDAGGCLRLYTSGSGFVDIEPVAGTVVVFNSRDFAHEVLESTRERRSVTGWFKVRPR